MAHALRIEDYLPPPPRLLDAGDAELLERYGDELVKSSSARSVAAERYAAATLRTERSADELVAIFRKIVEAAEGELSRGELDVSLAIEHLRTMEEECRDRWLPAVEVAERGREIALGIPDRAAASAVASLFDRVITATTRILEAVRDCRWHLLALRAEAEDQAGKTFDNAEDLLRHLRRS
jgi:hypothetical protein